MVRSAAGLAREAGDGQPENGGIPDGLLIELARLDHQIGRYRVAIEIQREVIRRENLTQHQRSLEPFNILDVAGADAESLEFSANKAPERIRSGPGNHRGGATITGCRNSDIGGRSAEELSKTGDVFEAHTRLQGVNIDAHATHREHVEMLGSRGIRHRHSLR